MSSTRAETDYVEFRRQVTRAVARLCPAWLSAEREDIVQVAMMRLHRLDDSSEGSGHRSSSYIWKTAFSVVVDEIRRRGRRAETALADIPDRQWPADGGPDGEQRVIARQLGKAIRACLATLVSARRTTVVLHLQGHTVPEVARLLGHAEKKAENLVYRGISDLRRCLTSKGLSR